MNLLTDSDIIEIALSFLITVILAPVMEEILFRGIIFKSLNHISGFTVAAVVSAGVFAVLHMELVASISMFFVGLIIAYVYYSFGDIKMCVAIHMLNNMLAFFITLIYKDTNDTESLDGGILFNIVPLVIAMAIVICSLKRVRNISRGYNEVAVERRSVR